jgi:CubicO group peptidase (beta-lactamase class C family)
MQIATARLTWFLVFSSIATLAAGSTNFCSEADAYLAKLAAREEFSGSVLIATNGSVVFAKGYGMANRELSVPNTTNTIFRIGSITKQFTTMCILILQEEHKLNATNPISQYIPDCPPAWHAITVQHLLAHTSGIPNFTDFPDNPNCERLPASVMATVKRFRDKPLEFEPGKGKHYSNSGYVLLGYIIEQVTGMTYEKFVAEKVFVPLGMKHSGYDHPATILPQRASGYSKQGTNIVNCIPFAMDTPHAAGALYSTVGDLLIWDQSLCSARLVSARTLDLFTPVGWGRHDTGNGVEHWQLGEIDYHCGNRVQYFATGGISGFLAHETHFPEEKLYVAVLSNFGWANSPGIAEKLCSMYFDTGQ